MTCIVGLVDKGVVYMGGDSAGVGGLSISIRTDEKVFINGPFLMGFTSSFRMGQLLRYKFGCPEQTNKQTDMEYMVTSFIDSVRKCFANNGYGKIPERDNNVGGNFLVGYKGNLYSIHSDFQVGRVALQYDACGCGEDLALGSLFSTTGKKPAERVKIALDAASKFSAGVAPPYTILSLPKK